MWNKWFGNYNMRHDCDRNCSFDGKIEASTDWGFEQRTNIDLILWRLDYYGHMKQVYKIYHTINQRSAHSSVILFTNIDAFPYFFFF